MGRRLSLLLGLSFVVVLLIGGVSILAARSIYLTTQDIKRQGRHVEVMDSVHAAVHHLTGAVQQSIITGVPYPEDERKTLVAELHVLLNRYERLEEMERDFPESQRETKIYREVRETIADLVPLSQRLFIAVAREQDIDPRDLEQLTAYNAKMPAQAHEMNEVHRIKMERMIQESWNRMWLILGLYLAFIVIGSLLILGSNLVFYRTIVLPIRGLVSATLEVASGDFRKRVSVTSRDEIGQLSNAFNVMAENLQEHERQLRSLNESLKQKAREAEALYKIGTEILGSLDLDKILRSVVEKAKELLGCEVGALCLLDDEEPQLVPRVTSGPPAAFAGARIRGVERALPVNLMDHCPPAGGTQGLKKPLLCCGVVRPQYLENHLAVPLKTGEKVIGVFCVADRRPRGFSSAEVDLLTGLATQAAIAIENARLYDKVQGLAILEERERIAREMHDGLAQALGTLHFQVSRAQDLLNANETARVQTAMEKIQKMAEDAYEDVRQAIFGLRTMVSRSLGLVPTLTEYLHDWSLQNGVTADLQIQEERATKVSPGAELQLIRIIQEALANVRKHAAARYARVRFELEGEHVLVTVTDDGKGFDPTQLPRSRNKGYGLETMRERAESVGGSLKVQSQLGRGTSVSVRLPLSGKGDHNGGHQSPVGG
ncbi:MAG: ATP-binding protein [Candidatus Methylomirabilales bacterium]